MEMDDVAFSGLLEIGARLARRELSPVELTRAMLERIETLNPTLRPYAATMSETALQEAERSEAELMRGQRRGPLHGVPVAVKDLCDTTGVPTACGFPMFRSRRPQRDATVVRRLREAGAVILGKLQLTEGALAVHHPDVAPPVNPWHAEAWSGASSSGSGVATAAGLCFGALGSDTGGSIRFPALCNGVVGIKPTWGRVSRAGVFPLSETLDHVGPLARSVEDAAAVLGAIAGRDADDPTSAERAVPDYLAELGRGIRGVRIGYDEAYCSQGIDPQVAADVARAVSVLAEQGAEIRAMTMPPVADAAAAWTPICVADAALAHAETYPSRKEGYSETYRAFLDAGLALTAVDYARAEIARRRFAGNLAALFETVDLIVGPVMPWPVLTLPDFDRLCAEPDGLQRLIAYTSPYDVSGSPTISLPTGIDGRGIPGGFQLAGLHFEEDLLCRAGKAWQDASGWRPARPPLAA